MKLQEFVYILFFNKVSLDRTCHLLYYFIPSLYSKLLTCLINVLFSLNHDADEVYTFYFTLMSLKFLFLCNSPLPAFLTLILFSYSFCWTSTCCTVEWSFPVSCSTWCSVSHINWHTGKLSTGLEVWRVD